MSLFSVPIISAQHRGLYNTVFHAQKYFHFAQDKSSCEPNIAYPAPE
jgi:hypothetical protein